LRCSHAARTLLLAPNAARPTVGAERNHHGTRIGYLRRIGSNKFYGKFEDRMPSQYLPHTLYFGKALGHKGRHWQRMKIPSQQLVGRIADKDGIGASILFQT